ncbi:hypothetical protein [Sorangium sp. So ce388]|uniref:hypothetical protein n=1 Tax=Sorangium sp. So ce388 TaxID=3133309 RepID=UPI003F5BE847
MSASDAAVDVGRLLAFALDVTAAPGSGGVAADYARLVQRYVEDAPFRSLFDGVVEGAGCEVTTADRNIGLVLRTRSDGPWAWPARSADLPWNRSFEEMHPRAARALVVVALLAYVAPSAADLDDLLSDADVVLTTVAVRELERFIRDYCEQCEADTPDPTGDVESRPLWWHWLQMPAETPTDKRISRGTTTYIVYDVLSFLHNAGWLIDASPNRPAADKRYRPRRRLIHHYRDLLLDDVFGALRRHAESASIGAAPPDGRPSDGMGRPVKANGRGSFREEER